MSLGLLICLFLYCLCFSEKAIALRMQVFCVFYIFFLSVSNRGHLSHSKACRYKSGFSLCLGIDCTWHSKNTWRKASEFDANTDVSLVCDLGKLSPLLPAFTSVLVMWIRKPRQLWHDNRSNACDLCRSLHCLSVDVCLRFRRVE